MRCESGLALVAARQTIIYYVETYVANTVKEAGSVFGLDNDGKYNIGAVR